MHAQRESRHRHPETPETPATPAICARRQRGAALLAAMLTVTLVAVLAAAAMWRQWRGVEVEIAERARTQSSWILSGALHWGRMIIREDGRAPAGDSTPTYLGQPWAMPLAESRLNSFLAAGEDDTGTDRDAFLSGEMVDLQSRLNVTNLVRSNDQTDAFLRFERLFSALNLPAAELRALQDNLRAAYGAAGLRTQGGRAPPTELAGAPLLPLRVDQLGWLGLSPGTLATLKPYISLLPDSTAVNFNTAPAPVLFAAEPQIRSLADAQRLVAARALKYFRSCDEALRVLNIAPETTTVGTDGVLPVTRAQWCAATTKYFEIRGRLRLDNVALEEVAVARRDSRGNLTFPPVTLLSRQREALTVIPGQTPGGAR